MRNFRNTFLGVWGIIFLTTSLASTPAKAAEQLKPSQLVGTWVHTNPANMDGLEFTKDGKVLVYIGGGNDAMTADYSIVSDGRLNISMGGLAQFFVPSMSGEQLQLKEPDTGNVAQYRRLKAGETMAAAITAQKQAGEKAVNDRNAAVPDFLKRKDLVMLFINGGPSAPANSTVEFVPNGTEFTGRALYDSKPPHMEALNAQIQGTDNPRVTVTFGVANSSQNGNNLQISFHPVGTAPNITLTAAVNFGGVFDNAANSTAVIKPDDTMRKQILDHFKSETARLEALKAPVVAMLKDYAVFKGTSQSALAAERDGFADEFVLSRNPQNNTWAGQGQSVNRATGATEILPVVIATVGIVSEKPAIQILSQKKLYQFTDIDVTAGKLIGTWQMPNNPNGRPAALAITQALDVKGRDQLFTARKAALLKMGADAVFHGVLNDQYPNGAQPPNPVTVTLSVAENGAITGKAEYALEGCTMTLAGREVDTPQGPALQLRYTDAVANPGAWADVAAFIKLVQHETWMLSPTGDAAGPIRLGGYSLTSPGPGSPPNAMQLISYTDKDKAAVAAALNGARFKVTTPRMDQVPATILEITVDPATQKITGRVAEGGYHLNATTGTTLTGEMKDQSGWIELSMPIQRKNDAKPVYNFTAVVTPTEGGLYLNGDIYNITQGPTRVMARWDAVQVKTDAAAAKP
jgi:hypothetical protein